MLQTRTFKAAMLGSGSFLVTLTGLGSAAVLSRILIKSDYAAYKQTLLAYTFLAPLLSLGLPQALFYFLPRDKEHGKTILSGNLLLLFFMGFLFAVAMWCGGNELLAKRFDNPALSKLLLIYSPYGLLILPVSAIGACLVSSDRVKILTIYNVVSRIVIFVFVVGMALIWRTPDAAVSGAVIAAFLVFFPAIFLMYRATDGNDWRPKYANMISQMKYSVPLGIASLMGVISLNLDKVLVSSMCTPDEFAVYVNGAIEIPLIGVITGSVMSILIPELSALYQRKEYPEILSLWHRAMIKCALLIFPIMTFLFLMAPEIMKAIFSAKYIESMHPFRVYLLALPIRITQFGAIFMSTGKTKLILYRSVIGIIINFILSIALIKVIGSLGAAISTVFVVYFWAVSYNVFFIRRILRIDLKSVMPLNELIKAMIISIVAALVFLLSPLFTYLGDVFAIAGLGSIYAILVLGLFDYFGLIEAKHVLLLIKERIWRK